MQKKMLTSIILLDYNEYKKNSYEAITASLQLLE
jgi:hypothetical protein